MTNMLTNITLLLIAGLCFLLAACATPEQTVAATVAAVGAAGEFIAALKPILSPEMQAKLTATASQIDGTVQATSQAVAVLADAISTASAKVGQSIDAVSGGLAAAKEQIASRPGREEVYLVGGGTGAAGTVASRLLSHFKHTKPS